MGKELFQINHEGGTDIFLNPSTLVKTATSLKTWHEILSFYEMLVTDKYIQYTYHYYLECMERFGESWTYLDLVNVLFTSSKLLQPKKYLEIGVRRGRSACTVGRACPSVEIVGFDMWIENYAGVDNPGPEYVKDELKKHGHKGKVTLISGDSHVTVPQFFKENPTIKFDLINVDGDHSDKGAHDDLYNVIPYLSVGGIIVFDDITHPSHKSLLKVWKQVLEKFPFLVGCEYTENGNGVAFAIRTSE